MSKKALTSDEKLLLALEASDIEGGVNPIPVAASIGLSPKTCKTILNLLAQANFIKKTENGNVYITAHGKSLCEQIKCL